MSKLLRELKWLVASFAIVGLVICTFIGIANFSQWRVNQNMMRLDAGEIQAVQFTRWK